jgi:hypothetical protein
MDENDFLIMDPEGLKVTTPTITLGAGLWEQMETPTSYVIHTSYTGMRLLEEEMNKLFQKSQKEEEWLDEKELEERAILEYLKDL